jgi:hypothetical protein
MRNNECDANINFDILKKNFVHYAKNIANLINN